MAAAREIRLKLRIDDDGLPIDLKRAADKIGTTFASAADRMTAAFDGAADHIRKTMAAIAKTPIAAEPIGLQHLDALSARLTEIQKQTNALRSSAGAAIVPPLAPVSSTSRLPVGSVIPSAVPAVGTSRLPASVLIANRAAVTANQNAAAAQVVSSIASGLPPSAGASVSRLTALYNALSGAAGGAGKSISGIGPAVDRVSLLFAGLGGAIAVFRTIGAAINASLIQPVERLGERFIEATENSRKFENAIGGIVGMSRARELNYALVSASRDQPADVAALRQTGQTFGALPALAGKLNDNDAAKQIISLNRTVARLATLDPAQGEQGGTTAIREILEGGGGGDAFNSIRRRFGLSASTLAHAIGETVDNIKADPALALRAVEKITSTLIPDSIVDQSRNLFTVKVQKIRDALDQALVRVGDSGSFDHLVTKVDGVMQQLFKALDSDAFARQARKVSDAVSRATDSIGASVSRFLRAATGARADQPIMEVVGDALATGVRRLADIIDNIPAIAEKIGVAVGHITDQVGRLIDALTEIADATRHPEKVAGRLGDYAAQRLESYAVNTDLGKLGNDLGSSLTNMLHAIGGDAKDSPANGANAPAKLYAQAQQPPPAASAADDRFMGDFGKMIRQLDSATATPNFGATLLGSNAAFGRLDDLTRVQPDRLSQIGGAGQGAFAASNATLGRLQDQMLKAIDGIDNALADGARRLKAATDPAEIAQIQGGIESIERVRGKLVESFKQAGQTAGDSLTEAASSFRRGLADELADLPLGGAAALHAATGRNAQIDAAMGKLGELGVQGGPSELSTWALKDQQNFWTRMSERGLGDIEAQARTGAVSVGMTPEQIDRAAAIRPDDRQIQESQASLIGGQLLPAQRGILNSANANLSAHPDDPLAIRDAAKATEQYAALAAKLHDLHDSLDGLTPGFREFAAAVRESLEQGLGDLLYQLTTGANSLRETFANLAQSILKEFLDLQARNLVQGLIGDAGKQQASGQSGGWGGVVGAILGAFTGTGAAGAQAGAAAGSAIAAADGAVFEGGFQAFAAGGVARRPMLGLIGEGRHPEAIVPMPNGHVPIGVTKSGEFFASLPGGRRISAKMEGGMRAFATGGIWEGRAPSHISPDGGMYMPAQRNFESVDATPQIYVVNDVHEAVRAGFRKNKDTLVSMMAGDIAKGGQLGKAMRR